MSVLICKMCGGDLEIKEGMTTARCPYCGTNQTVPKLDDEKRLKLYDRANHFRRSNDYDKAMAIYEQILDEDQTDSEAYWSVVLCRYGIEYVEDLATHRRIPTVNRTQYTSILSDEDYKAALHYADVVQAKLYEQEAEAIYTIQKGILQVSQKEDAYDIFICYKETDDAGERTKDSVLADEIYCQLVKEGYRVFFARITLQDKLGSAYEPYIFAALHSAKIMIVVGTTPENLQAVWVRNEWIRYLTLIRQGEKKVLIPAYLDMDPYDLPTEFSHLQALNMSKLGCMQDLLHGVRKILGENTEQIVKTECARPEYISLTDADRIDYQKSETKVRRTGWEPYGWKRGVVLGIILIVAILLLNSKGIYQRWKMDHGGGLESVQQSEKTEEEYDELHAAWDQMVTQERETKQDVVFNGILEEFVSRVYQCPANDVTDSQLARIKQLTMRRERDLWHIGYSFEASADDLILGFEEDMGDGLDDRLEWVSFRSSGEVDLNGLRRFTEVKKLDVCYTLTAENLRGLHPESVCAYFDSPEEAGNILGDLSTIKELGFSVGIESLGGIDRFENLETLYIEDLETDDIDALIHVDGLKNLSICCDEKLVNCTVIGKLEKLEKLSLSMEKLKVLDFVDTLKRLDTLKIDRAQIKALSGLENCKNLQSLTITNCIELKDTSAIAELVDLRELDLEVPYECSEPDLSDLTRLNRLSLTGQFEDYSFLRNMSDLEELYLNGSIPEEGENLSNLASLKKLSCYSSRGKELKSSSIEAFQTLEYLKLSGTMIYDDMSGLFLMPNLRELDISGMECQIDLDKVPENRTLEILRMNDMQLYENVQAYYGEGVILADMDETVLDEHTDFFIKFPELRELYLSGNGLTDISFAAELSALKVLDISDNYITELRPLAQLPSLQEVICTGNPLKSEKVLDDSVLIIGEDDQ